MNINKDTPSFNLTDFVIDLIKQTVGERLDRLEQLTTCEHLWGTKDNQGCAEAVCIKCGVPKSCYIETSTPVLCQDKSKPAQECEHQELEKMENGSYECIECGKKVTERDVDTPNDSLLTMHLGTMEKLVELQRVINEVYQLADKNSPHKDSCLNKIASKLKPYISEGE